MIGTAGRWMAALLLAVLFGCHTDTYPKPLPGSTYRIGKQVPAEESDITIHIFDDWTDCARQGVTEIDACVPRVNRATGEVRLSFMTLDPTTLDNVPRSFRRDDIAVLHDSARQETYEIVAQEGADSGQLFILVIDGSSSMFIEEGVRIKKLWDALLDPRVIQSFFPPDQKGKTGVVLTRFTKGVMGLDGGNPRVVRNVAEYKEMVQGHLMKSVGGYTHLYDAAKYAVTDLLQNQDVKDFLAAKSADPVIVLLTDGFNNEGPTDTCQDNVARLQSALDVIRERLRAKGSVTPRLYTVGLGQPYRPGKKPKGFNISVTPQGLCGPYIGNRIDDGSGNTGLEDYGIDHVSLEWLAEAGRGDSIVKNSAKGLAESFQAAAAKRYRWYQVFYKVPDNFYHRKSFETQIQLSGLERAYTKVTFHPSGWIDPPPQTLVGRWSEPGTMRHPFAVVMPLLGALVFLNFAGPAWFNARRALFRRARAKK